MALFKNQQKLITSLQQKKYRQQHQLFVAEGVKVVKEFLDAGVIVKQLFITDEKIFESYTCNKITITEDELKKISNLKSPNKVLGLFEILKENKINSEGLTIALDGINDPGNFGTIIRLCDWFGVKQLICSKNTVDCFNPKVIQSTMGSLTRVKVNYVDLVQFLSSVKVPVFTADLNGDNVYKKDLPNEAVLVMGNEANGISSEINSLIKNKLTIPRFGNLQQTESLNVATATGILLSEFRR